MENNRNPHSADVAFEYAWAINWGISEKQLFMMGGAEKMLALESPFREVMLNDARRRTGICKRKKVVRKLPESMRHAKNTSSVA